MKIKDICTGINDGSHNPPQGISVSKYLMLSSKNIFDNQITLDDPRYLSEEDFERENKRTKIAAGDVLLTIVGTVGRSAVVGEDMPCFTLQRSVAVLHPKKDVCSSKYLMYALQSKRSYIESRAKGVAQKGIYLKEVSDIELKMIPLSDQQAIVETLDKIATIIRMRNAELQKLDGLIKARFVEMFGDPIINSKNLETRPLKDVLILKAGDFTAASAISDEPTEANIYPCYGGNGIRGYVAAYNQDGEYSLVGRQGALSGNVQYTSGKFKNTEHALLVTPIVEMNSIWLNQLLVNLELKRYQTGAAQPGLSVKNLQDIQILCVPAEEQNQFADFVKQVDKSKVIDTFIHRFQELITSIMDTSFKGDTYE